MSSVMSVHREVGGGGEESLSHDALGTYPMMHCEKACPLLWGGPAQEELDPN